MAKARFHSSNPTYLRQLYLCNTWSPENETGISSSKQKSKNICTLTFDPNYSMFPVHKYISFPITMTEARQAERPAVLDKTPVFDRRLVAD